MMYILDSSLACLVLTKWAGIGRRSKLLEVKRLLFTALSVWKRSPSHHIFIFQIVFNMFILKLSVKFYSFVFGSYTWLLDFFSGSVRIDVLKKQGFSWFFFFSVV